MSEQTNSERKVTSHVIAEYGQISANVRQGWARSLKLVSWNDNPAKFDIREWNGDKAGKGMTFTREEIRNLRDLLSCINLEQLPCEVATGQNGHSLDQFRGEDTPHAPESDTI